MTIERHDTWYGWQPVEVKAFRTKRKGVAVTRYRTVAKAGGWYSSRSFETVAGAERFLAEACKNIPCTFREVA